MSIPTINPSVATWSEANAQSTRPATRQGVAPEAIPRTAPPEESPSGPERLQQALEEIRQAFNPVARNLLFSLDEESGTTIIKVVDAQTDEEIRQIPSEELLNISKALGKLQGLLLEQQA